MKKVWKALLAMKEAADEGDCLEDSHHAMAVRALEEFQTEWEFKPNPTHLKAIAAIVGNWLARHGGMASGYNTHVNGRVCTDGHGFMEVVLPGNDDRTVRQNRDMGNELLKLIQTYMRAQQFGPTDVIMFASKHLGNDNYEMSIMYFVEQTFKAGLANKDDDPT